METKNAELEKVSADLEPEIQALSSKIVVRQDSWRNKLTTKIILRLATSILYLELKSISEAITVSQLFQELLLANTTC